MLKFLHNSLLVVGLEFFVFILLVKDESIIYFAGFVEVMNSVGWCLLLSPCAHGFLLVKVLFEVFISNNGVHGHIAEGSIIIDGLVGEYVGWFDAFFPVVRLHDVFGLIADRRLH